MAGVDFLNLKVGCTMQYAVRGRISVHIMSNCIYVSSFTVRSASTVSQLPGYNYEQSIHLGYFKAINVFSAQTISSHLSLLHPCCSCWYLCTLSTFLTSPAFIPEAPPTEDLLLASGPKLLGRLITLLVVGLVLRRCSCLQFAYRYIIFCQESQSRCNAYHSEANCPAAILIS
jgi:hypothetical protein